MPDFVVVPIFRAEELGASARDAARAWARQHVVPDDWHECVIDDFERVCTIIGVELATRSIRLFGGGTREAPQVHFSGFSAQGDGASFEGRYRYARCSTAAIRAYAPLDRELHRIADAFVGIQRRNIYQLDATIRQTGRYFNEYTMEITVERDSPTGQAATAGAEDGITECLRDLARWLYRQLEREYDFQTADAEIDAALHANDYTFTAGGAPFP